MNPQVPDVKPVGERVCISLSRTRMNLFYPLVLPSGAVIPNRLGRGEDAVRDMREAVVLEDGLAYDEPAGWFFPVRHLLGAELLRLGKANDAERTYRDDLARHPGSGWALYGLKQALKAEGRGAEASAAEAEFRTAWRQATISISASAF